MNHQNYKQPQDILDDPKLTKEQKISLLEDWAVDENEKLTAEEENMPLSDGQDDNVGELLSKIDQALHSLKND